MSSIGVFFFDFLCIFRVFSDLIMSFFIKFFNSLDFDFGQVFNPLAEVGFIIFFAFFLQSFHVFVNMSSENSFSVDSSVISHFFFGVLL